MNPIRDWVEETPLVDTHEHLLEESQRLKWELNAPEGVFHGDDWSYVFWQYLPDDFGSAGMSGADKAIFLGPDATSEEKYRIVAPWWEKCKHTGYGQAVRLTLQGLYGEDDLTPESLPRIAEKYRETVRPGFYQTILKEKANLDHCQVNSLQAIFMESAQPDLLRQDLSVLQLSTEVNQAFIQEHRAKSLDDWLGVIEGYFTKYGHRAVAVKSQCAYMRPLSFDPPDQKAAEDLFLRVVAGEKLPYEERKPMEDFLFDLCVRRATEAGLPVKLHTGYLAGVGYMDLGRVRANPSDLCPLLQRHPDTKFVLMHIGFPYESEMIALAKHYPNVFIDMCWAWILSPGAGVRFLKEYLMTAPVNKVFTFGGDYLSVEPIYGHSRIARMGIVQAVSQLVEEGWLRLEEAREVIERIMRGNALELFPRPEITKV